MTTFKNLKEAVDFAVIKKEEFEIDYIMIMKKGDEYAVTTDYKAGRAAGFESYLSLM